MSNIKDVRIKGIPVNIGGKDRNFKFDLNAFAILEEEYGTVMEALNAFRGETDKDENGKPIMLTDKDGNKVEQRKFKLKPIRTLIYAGLSHEDDNLTEKQVGAMLDFSTLPEIAEKLTEAITGAMPELTDEDKAKAEFATKQAENRIKETTKPEGVHVVKNVKSEEE